MAKNEISIRGLINFFRAYEDITSSSLSEFGKRCTINSRAYIQAQVAQEPIVKDILRNIQNIYVGWIFTALQMNTFVSEDRKVRDLIETVATENFGMSPIGNKVLGVGFGDDFANCCSGTEFFDNYDKDKGNRPAGKVGTTQLKNISLPSGRVISVQLSHPARKEPIDVEMLIQITPRVIASEVSEQLVALNFNKSFYKRYLQYQAGELRFWQDFIFQYDELAKRRTALKRDHTGDLKNILDRQNNSLNRQLLKLLQIFPDYQNIANSIMVFDKQSFDRFASNAHLNFKKYSDRQKYFGKSYSVALVTVDPMYNQVNMYINGIDAIGTYDYDQMKSVSEKDSVSMVELMQAMSQGNSPRF